MPKNDTDEDMPTVPTPPKPPNRSPLHEADSNGGWPGEHLSAEPPSAPELSEYPGAPELARAYATVTISLRKLLPQLVEAIQWLYGAVMGAKATAAASRDRVGEVAGDLRKLDRTLQRVARRLQISLEPGDVLAPLPPPAIRDPESSHHEFDPAVRDFRETMRALVNEQGNDIDEKKATEFIRGIVTQVSETKELGTYRKIKKGIGSLALQALQYGIGPIIVGVAMYIWHLMQMAGALAHK